ncbi:hypothetical protein PIB30_032125 [Stylosanthes scabra]|uniref:Uncharacterized protein n=1 Tax=Stylosanthes scabra TaxID=79078 RepID=A0ABU6VAW0_9FABA|nr:hypothetical protein [Stylosanthes scabra]
MICLRGSSPTTLNDHQFLTVDAVSLAFITLVMRSSPFMLMLVIGRVGPSSTTYLGYGMYSDRECGPLWTMSLTFDSEVVALVIPRAGNLRFSPLSSHLTQDILLSPSYLTTQPLFVGLSTPRPPRSAVSPTSSASSGLSDGVPREHERSPRAPVPVLAPASVYPPPRMPMMDARHYCDLFVQRRTVLPTPPSSDDEPSVEDDDECKDSAGDASLSSRDVSSADAS